MQRPEQMDKVVDIMTHARDQHRKLSHDEAMQLDKLLQNIFHKQ